LVVASGVSGAADVWVRHLNRFLVDSFNSGTWIVLPQQLDGVPGLGCTGVSSQHDGRCGLTQLGTFGEVLWFWYYENQLGEELRESKGDLIAQFPDGRLERVWGIRSVTARMQDAIVFQKGVATFLHVQLAYPGTGSNREDVVFQWRSSHWQEMDTWSWRKQIVLPPCYGMWKGPFIDFEAMSLESKVWIDGDGNCCPSGGTVTVSFEFFGEELRVVKWNHDMSLSTGSPQDPWRRCER
jgi:hypothetical protein